MKYFSDKKKKFQQDLAILFVYENCLTPQLANFDPVFVAWAYISLHDHV